MYIYNHRMSVAFFGWQIHYKSEQYKNTKYNQNCFKTMQEVSNDSFLYKKVKIFTDLLNVFEFQSLEFI